MKIISCSLIWNHPHPTQNYPPGGGGCSLTETKLTYSTKCLLVNLNEKYILVQLTISINSHICTNGSIFDKTGQDDVQKLSLC